MDAWITRTYIQELRNQAEAAELAAEDLDAALNTGNVARSFAAVQALLAAGAMVSKMIWPSPRSPKWSRDRGEHLEQTLGVASMEVLRSRRVRNSLEHFDERLDEYFQDGHRSVFDRNIGPKNSMIVVDGEIPLHLRLLDPRAGTISVLNDDVRIKDLVDALRGVGAKADVWLTLNTGQ